MTAPVTLLGAEIRDGLAAAADPALAPGMAAYMKVAENSGLGFLGVRRPDVRRIARGPVTSASDEDKLDAVLDLWDNAQFHEERHAAQDLLALRWTSGRLDLLDLHRRMALEGAWWDHVDEIAHRIGDLVLHHHDVMGTTLRAWSVEENRWIRRLSIIGQLGLREQIDLDLLADAIAPNATDSEFFLRKAIGWALRDAARTHPDWVRTFVASHELSPLSRREALKHLG